MSVQYKTNVTWDSTLISLMTVEDNATTRELGIADLVQTAVKITTGAPTVTANRFLRGAIVTNAIDGTNYENTGTVAAPTWTLFSSGGSGITALTGDVTASGSGSVSATIAANAVTTAKILNANVTLAKLATGIIPSHVVKFAGKITWSGSGASLATTVTGVLSTDIVVASIQTAPTQAAYLVSAAPTTDTVTLVLSAANTSNQAVISYQVLRVAS